MSVSVETFTTTEIDSACGCRVKLQKSPDSDKIFIDADQGWYCKEVLAELVTQLEVMGGV